jgi:integrase
MALRMVSLKSSKTGEWIARKGIPADARAQYKRLYGVGQEAILRVPAGTSKAQAKAQHGQWLAEVETRIERIRAAAKGEGQPLTKYNALALAGRWYSWFVGQYESDPGAPKRWSDLSDHYVWQVLYPHAPPEHHEDPNADPSWPWTKSPEVRAAVRPVAGEMARVASFLASEGLALTADATILFVDAVADNLNSAFGLLEMRAAGNYSRDAFPETFPVYQDARRGASAGLSPWDLFGAYVDATEPAGGTVNRWRAVFQNLQAAFPASSADALTEADARGWTGKLVTAKRSAVTVDAVWLAAANIVFSWAAKQKRIRSNPFAGIKIDIPKVAVLRETKAFKPEEAQVILRAATAIANPRDAFPRAKRWVMWLCAYSGARSGEIAQLRGIDVAERGDLYVMKLTPEAGTIKTVRARTVPLHEHIVAQGFMEFVRARGDGPLFYNERPESETDEDPLNPTRSPAVKTRGRLGAWVRSLGIDDPEVGPTHGWRHTFKQIAERAQISEKVSDAITGHAPATIGRSYGAPTVEDMAEALKKFPRYIV